MEARTGHWLVVMTIDGRECPSSVVASGDHYKCARAVDRLNASPKQDARVRWVVRKGSE